MARAAAATPRRSPRQQLLALLLLAQGARGWAGVLDVRAFGAMGDGATLDTAAIRAALGAAAVAGGGEVLFPGGYRFLTRPFNVTSNVHLNVAGQIAFSDDPSADWPVISGFAWFGPVSAVQFQPLIMGWGVSNVSLSGGGTLDGNGTKWWPCAVNPAVAPCFGTPRPPAFFMPFNGSGLDVFNVTFVDSPMWNLRPAFMDYVHIRNVTIRAPASTAAVPSHNTDGIVSAQQSSASGIWCVPPVGLHAVRLARFFATRCAWRVQLGLSLHAVAHTPPRLCTIRT